MLIIKKILFQWFINFLIKNKLQLQSETLATLDRSASSSIIKNENVSDTELAEELHKPVIRNLKKQKYTHFLDNIWGADLADMQLMCYYVLLLLMCYYCY